jgi:2-polyprenyl-3-methyl-5-hydroxy-6-metoxy-1,4-benzoquinol methylase
MDEYKETFDTWNKVALRYQEKFMDLTLYDETYDFLCQLIEPKQAKLLDIGCGPGNITKYLLSKRPDYYILGIDVAPNMIELARKNNPTASFATMDCRQIATLPTKYDGIVCGFCLPYLSQADNEKFITDCSKLLNDNGKLYLSFVEGEASKSGFQISSTGHRAYFYFYSLENLLQLLQKNHFKQLNVFKVNYQRAENENEIHTIIIAQKKRLNQASL